MKRLIGLGVLMMVMSASALLAQTLPPMSVDHLIITNDELADEFWRLADLRQAEGMRSRVVTMAWIADNLPAGEDDAATLRTFIAAAHAQWGVRFVLLGGDIDVVPTRMVRSTFYPYGGHTDIPADLYFAGLDGDWNADGDEWYGEPFVSDMDPGDAADLSPDVALGRAPVSTPAEAARFVDGTIAADGAAQVGLPDALLLAEVMFPADWNPGDPVTLDGAQYADAIATMIAGLDDPPAVWRLYENDLYPRDGVLTLQSALDGLGGGQFGLVYHVNQGWLDNMSCGDEVMTTADALALPNAPDYFVITGVGSGQAAFHQDGLYRSMLTAPAGGAVAAVGNTTLAFPSTSFAYTQDLATLLYLEGPQRLAPAVDQVRVDHLDQTERNTVDRWTQLSLAVLGDPALRVGPVPVWSEIPLAAPPATTMQLAPARPNPFNPTTELSFDLARDSQVRLDVFDVSGRRVATLVDGHRAAGHHSVIWHATAADGSPLASGTYVARLSGGAGRVSQRLSLVR